jgi:hypothetical protein
MNLKNLKTRLNKLEQAKRKIAIEEECICFPPDEPPYVELSVEREAVAAVTCRIHGKRFQKFAGTVYRSVNLPTHLDADWRPWRSPQYVKAMDASFPSDRWPAAKVTEPDGAVRFVLKDGTEILRLPPPEPVYDYGSGKLAGFLEGYPPKFRAISMAEPS